MLWAPWSVELLLGRSEKGTCAVGQNAPDLDQAWRIGEDAFSYVCSIIRQNRCRFMVEFGSGASTIRWALEFPDLSILAFEHDPKFAEDTEARLRALGLAHRVELRHAPLRRRWINGRLFTAYDCRRIEGFYDIVIIDGPPHYTRRGREVCLYDAYAALRVGGTVVLDDANRADEKAIVANWLAVYPGSFEYTWVDVQHGLAILRKIEQLPRRRISPRALRDFYSLKMRQAAFSVRGWLRRILPDPGP